MKPLFFILILSGCQYLERKATNVGHTIIILVLSLTLFACEKAEDKFPDEVPTQEVKDDYRSVSQSIAERFIHGGFGVVSRGPDGSPKHQGEALIWGGTFLWAAPCEISASVNREMAGMVQRMGGQLIRVDPLGEYVGGREVTLDGAIGFMLGVSRQLMDCNEWQLWQRPIEMMIAFHDRNNDKLHRQVEAKLVGEWKYIRDMIAHRIGLSSNEPNESRLRDLEKMIGGWALAVQTAHASGVGSDACFRINLGLSSLLAVETLQKGISQGGRDQFCQNTKGMNIPTVSHWCGRENINEYLATYEPNVWEYRHQRCQWESPDGKGNTSHQLDKLVAYVLANGWNSLQN